jgi:hypothetical protein
MTLNEQAHNLVLPCLLLDWRDSEPGETDSGGRTFDFHCTYKMLLPVVGGDIRKPEGGTLPFIEVPMSGGQTTQTGSWVKNPSTGQLEAPRRDGVHAMRDAAALRIPLYTRYKGEYQICHIHPQDHVRYAKDFQPFWNTKEGE